MMTMDPSDWAAWGGVMLGGLSLGLQWWQHIKRGPKLDVSASFDPKALAYALVDADIYNDGDAAVDVESMEITQGEARFGVAVRFHNSTPGAAGQPSIHLRPYGHARLSLVWHPRSGVPLDSSRPASFHVRHSAARKPIVTPIAAASRPVEVQT